MSEIYGGSSERSVELLAIEPPAGQEKVVVEVRAVAPLVGRTLGDLGIAYEISARAEASAAYLRIGLDPSEAPWIDLTTVRVFYSPGEESPFRVIWQSGVNLGLGYIWAKVDGPGTYVALGLPRDRVLLETLRQVALTRRAGQVNHEETRRLTVEPLQRLIDLGGDELDELRNRIAVLESALESDRYKKETMTRGRGFGVVAPPLPGGVRKFADLWPAVQQLAPPPEGLPEEQLFFPPDGGVPLEWPPRREPVATFGILGQQFRSSAPFLAELPWLSRVAGDTDWPMYMHDGEHTGRAASSGITVSNVSKLAERHKVAVNGSVASQPAIVGGSVYVGTMNASGTGIGGVLYKINLATGIIEGSFSIDDGPARQGRGIACTPAVSSGKVYFSGLNGKLYCLDASTMTQLWVVNLRKQDLPHNQPVDHGMNFATGWSSPVVVNGRVYVGSGEGEHDSFGYVYCIRVETGDVEWLFCTDKYVDPNNPGNENQPNVIPPSHWTGGGSPPPPFMVAVADPPHPGSAPWSSAAFDSELNRIYIGTGNAEPDTPLPDPRYASGIISLDATTGQFAGFFQPAPSDSYRPTVDMDVDVPGAPTVFTRSLPGSWPIRQRVVGIGSKNGSYFLLDADGLALLERRQLLPYDSGGNPFAAVDPPDTVAGARENKSGIFGTATVDPARGALFVGLGGYSGSIDSVTTPFIRAMSWNDLSDSWPTVGLNPPKYSLGEPPLYSTPGEAGLSNATSTNDVVFVGTTEPGLYAFDAATGFDLWAAPSFGPGSYCFGAAISGNHIVAGTGGNVYIYSL